jgi:hypothetical protein
LKEAESSSIRISHFFSRSLLFFFDGLSFFETMPSQNELASFEEMHDFTAAETAPLRKATFGFAFPKPRIRYDL